MAQNFDDLSIGTEVLSDLYRREGNIKILDKEMKKDLFNMPYVEYKVFFPNSGREGKIRASDINKIV